MKFALLFLFIISGRFAFTQESNWIEIEGKVLSEETHEPLPYLRIYNKTTKKGTISNSDGYFSISISAVSDSVVITELGYNLQIVALKPNINYYVIYLELAEIALEEVLITPKDDSYLFEMIRKCKKNESSGSNTAKAYYELKSYHDSTQIELVEGFYNAELNGSDVTGLHLKAGRLAIQPYENRLFTSQASSRAITQLKLTEENEYFPKTPISAGKREAEKKFYLILDYAYLDEKKDSVYVIHYGPKKGSEGCFSGDLWVNITSFQLEKITMNCTNCSVHPFLPLFPADSISNVDLSISKSFVRVDGKVLFNNVHFSYSVDYKSRTGKAEELSYSIKTNAILYAYDFKNPFSLPKFTLLANIDDYRKINAFPYNDFFWRYNDEYRLNDSENRNELFFSNPESVTNATFFKPQGAEKFAVNKKRGFFEHPYVHWSTNRIVLKEMIADSTTLESVNAIKAEMYHLDVKVFADLDSYSDSTVLLTETIIDPFTTYYYLPIDNAANCFINMYFDLCEIERRKWVATLKPNEFSTSQYEDKYLEFKTRLEKQQQLFLKETERGTNRKQLEKWNTLIKQELQIDNMDLFGLSE